MKWIRALRAKRSAHRRAMLDAQLREALIVEMSCDDPAIRAEAEAEWSRLPR